MTLRVLVRGGGDLASGAALRLWRAGWQVVVTELPEPRAVRRMVSFAQAVYAGSAQVEEIGARLAKDYAEAEGLLAQGTLPVVVDPDASLRVAMKPHVIVDGRMRKLPPETGKEAAALVIGLGPGFIAGENCHAVVETIRGPFLGRVIWQGAPVPDTGIPERVVGKESERVLRAPLAGQFRALAQIGDLLKAGQVVAEVGGETIRAPFDGALRGLLMDGLRVKAGEKVGDLDPRGDPRLCWIVSDKALAVGGGVVEAILSDPGLRRVLY